MDRDYGCAVMRWLLAAVLMISAVMGTMLAAVLADAGRWGVATLLCALAAALMRGAIWLI